ncbi:MAG: bifunctional nuclease family protein [Spirochaetia bacterium]
MKQATAEFRIEGMTFDEETRLPVVILKEKDGRRTLPVWIGPSEASSILLEIENIKTPRPMTHDLFFQFMQKHKFSIKKLVLSSGRDGKITARLFYGRRAFPYTIDVRPSDGIALALRSKSPIHATEPLIEQKQKMVKAYPRSEVNTSVDDHHPLHKGSDGLLM